MLFAPDHWEINIKGISVWSYFRFDHNKLPTSEYQAKIKFNFKDVFYFFKLLLLRYSNTETVVFLAARKDLMSLLKSAPFSNKKVTLFLREDGHKVQGNVFFIEVFRYLFRKYSAGIFKQTYKELERQLLSCNLDIVKHQNNIKAAVGDYYFNKILAFLLKGKKVYFSNCVIPKIERTEASYNSIEIQHGVIHASHPDYANIPSGIFNIPLLCWGHFWQEKIKKIGFLGQVIVGSSPEVLNATTEHQNSICFFTTLNDEVSEKIVISISKLKEFDIVLQCHPRDLFQYDIEVFGNVKVSKGLSPLEVKYPIMHDSTLIYVSVKNNKQFIYLASNNELKSEIVDRLSAKYDATYEKDYYIAYSPDEVVKFLHCFRSSD